MRKIFFLALISIAFTACEDVVEPSSVIQGEVDQSLFRSNAEAAFNNEGELIIQGSNIDVVTLKVNSNAVGMYEISPNSGNAATYVRDGSSYITNGPNTGGMIEIEEINEQFVTGNFFFEARRNGVGERLNFSKGVFYQVPFNNAEDPEDIDDDEDLMNANVNGANFNSVITNSEISGDTFSAISVNINNESIILFFPFPVDTGNYEIGIDEGFSANYSNGETPETTQSGNIEITNFNEDNGTVEGTFSFTTEEGTSVTDGEFIINF